MKKLMFIFLVTLMTACFSYQICAQGVVSAPLLLFTNGCGTISPFQYGQLLEVGQSYEMTAIPDSGFAFSTWQPVNVFTTTTVTTNGNGDPNYVSSIVTSLVPTYISQPVLGFTMQPEQVIVVNPLLTITESSGWLANFEPVPEPASMALIFSGLTVIVFHCKKRFRENDHANSLTGCKFTSRDVLIF